MPRSFFWAHRRSIRIVSSNTAAGKPSAPIHPLDTRPGGLKTRNKNMRDLAERAWGSLAIDDADELIRAIEYGSKTEYIPEEDFPFSMENWMFELDHNCESEYPPLRKNDSSWDINIKQNKIDLKKKKSLVWAAACSKNTPIGGATSCLRVILQLIERNVEIKNDKEWFNKLLYAYYQAMLMGRLEAARIILPYAAEYDEDLLEWDHQQQQPRQTSQPAWMTPSDDGWEFVSSPNGGHLEAKRIKQTNVGRTDVKITWPGNYKFTPWISDRRPSSF